MKAKISNALIATYPGIKHMMLTHRQLVHALSLQKQGNFTRAAEDANISQSAFSRSISNLEKSLGVLLFDRDSNFVTPTRFGEALLCKADVIVSGSLELQREIGLMQGLEVGSFAAAMGVYPAEVSGNRALGEMLCQHPNLQYQASVGSWDRVNELVLSRAADVGFAALVGAESDDRLVIEEVSQHEMVLYCRRGHPLAACKNLSKNDLRQYPLVSIRIPVEIADAMPGKSMVDPDSGHLVPAMEIDDFATAKTVVANSDGIGVAIPIQIEAELSSGVLSLLDFQRPWLMPTFGFVLVKHRAVSPAATLFMENVIALEQDVCSKNRVLLDKYLG